MGYTLTPQERAKAEAIARLKRDPQAWARFQAMEALRAQREQEQAQQQQQKNQETAQRNGMIGTVAAPLGTIGGMYLYNSLGTGAASAGGLGTAGAGSVGALGAGATGATTAGAGAAGATTGAAGAAGTGATAGGATAAGGASGTGAATTGFTGAGALSTLGIGAALASALKNTYDAYEAGSGKGAAEGAKTGYSEAPWWGKASILPLIGGALGGVFGQKSTRDIARGHTADLLEQGKDNAAYQAYVKGMREQYNAAPPDPSKPFHGGQYGSWDEYRQAGLDANDLTGVYGNIKTYGPQWASLTEDQRRAVTQANINSGLYYSKKGEVEISDQEKAKQNFDAILGGSQSAPKAAAPLAPGVTPNDVAGAAAGLPANPDPGFQRPIGPGAMVLAPARSSTTSPGIGLDGQPIQYGQPRRRYPGL